MPIRLDISDIHTVSISASLSSPTTWAKAAELMVPCELLKQSSQERVSKETSNGGVVQSMFGLENVMQGGTIYSSTPASKLVKVRTFRTGDLVLALVHNSPWVLALGDPLCSHGGVSYPGYLRICVADTDIEVGTVWNIPEGQTGVIRRVIIKVR